MSSLDELMNTLNVGVQEKLDSLNGARDEAIDAAEEARDIYNSQRSARNFYVDAFNGDDQSDTPGQIETPLKTLGEAFRRQEAFRLNRIRLLSDVEYDEVLGPNAKYDTLLTGLDINLNPTPRTITIKDAKDGSQRSASLLIAHRHFVLNQHQINLHLDSQYPTSCLYLENADLLWRIRHCTVTQSATNQAFVLDRAFADASRAHIAASLFIPDGVDGQIVNGVAPGELIDDVHWISSNLTAL